MKALSPYRLSRFTAMLALLCTLAFSGRAQTFNFAARDNNNIHTASQIKAHNGFPDTIIVRHDKWDEMVSNGSAWSANLKFKSVHDFVKFYVDYGYPVKLSQPWTFKLTYKIYGYNNIADTINANFVLNDTLTVSYKPDSLAAFQDAQYKKYSGYHKIMIVLTGLYKIGSANDPPQAMDLSTAGGFSFLNFNVEGAILQQPYIKRLNTGSGYTPVYTPALAIGADAPDNDYLPVRWNLPGVALNSPLKVLPANYELEWTYIDNYNVDPSSGIVSTVSPANLNYNFKDNSTRIWLDTNYYRIPLIYQKGHLVYRVRMVRPDSVQFHYPIYGPWTLADNGTVSSAASGSKYEITQAHLNDSLNWQYTVSFAEQGKYKHVMSYYDGMLKNRQSITRFNSMPDKLIATEQVYDYEGRPSISLLPTPVNTGTFRYQFNLTLNQASGLPYRARDFDSLQGGICPLDRLPSRLADASPAYQYYSPTNPDQAGFQKFVPDAGGYPFVQTIYSPGYDERVEKQGGAGDSLQIGYNHTVKNDYVSADQMDLNRLFGVDIGWSGFYRKTVSRDPNGQLSLNVTDYHGKTVTSSMIGIPDTMLHALVANENLPDTSFYWEDHLAGTAQQIIGNQRILDKNFFNDAGGNNLARYIYTFTPWPTFCPGKYLSVKARYDYTIFDECGTIDLDTGGTLGTTGVVTNAASVSDSAAAIPFYMEKGKHSLHKELTVNMDDIDAAVDAFIAMKPTENCLRDEPWFIKQSVLSKEFPCPEDYAHMDCNPCAGKKYQMMQELWPNKDSTYIVRKYGIYRKVNDSVVGNSNSIFTAIVETIPSGDPEIPPIVVSRKYRYQDTCLVHLPASVTKFGHTYTNLQSLPVDTFIYIFNDSIAEALLPLHPEYCSLLECVDDHFMDVLQSIPDGSIAEQLGMLSLSGIINHDPLYTQMQANPSAYPNAYDTLAFTYNGVVSLDTMSLIHAYCNCSDSIMFQKCRDSMFVQQINGGILLNDYVRDRYFETVRSLYLGNRMRYRFNLNPALAGMGTCATCSAVRMQLVPQPIFPNVFDGNNLATGPGSFLGTVQSIDPAVGTTLSDYFNLLQAVDPDSFATFQSLNDSAFNVYNSYNATLCQGAVDPIIAQLVNCADSITLVGVRNYLLNLCSNGQVQAGNFSPAQIRAALVANGISLGDLCNPYLVNYDNNMAPPAEDGAFTCNNEAYYTDIGSTLSNSNVLNALKTPGSTYSLSLNAANAFQSGIKNALGGAASASVVATYNASAHLYTLKFSSGSASVNVYFKTAVSGTCAAAFSAASGEAITVTADCINSISGGFARGYVGKYAFAVTVHHNFSGGSVTHCSLPAWNNKVEINFTGENPIAGCVPCTQMRSLYNELWDTLRTYQVKVTNHPYYATMLRNFMNYKLKKAYTGDQYLDFIESCALADSEAYYRAVGNEAINFGTGYSQAFYDAISNAFPQIPVPVLWWYKSPAWSLEQIRLDLNQVPKEYYRDYVNFISAYAGPGVSGKYHNYWPEPGTSGSFMGYLVVDQASSIYNPAIFGTLPKPFTFSLFNVDFNFWNGTGFVPKRLYGVYSPDSLAYSANSYNCFFLAKFIQQNNLPAAFYPGLQSMVNDQYTLPDKQAYLNYTYNMQGLPPSRVLDTLQTEYLEQNISAFNGLTMSYGNTAAPGNIQNLYLSDPSGFSGPAVSRLATTLGAVSLALPNSSLLFGGSNTRSIPVSQGQLMAYRCADTAFWYRYFGPGDTLYNIFIRVPAYIDTSYYSGYAWGDIKIGLGEGSARSFKVNLQNNNAPIPDIWLDGYTDYTLSTNKVLKDVLLAHSLADPEPVADTVNNCERERLNAAIYEGKIQYRLYIDSVREALRSGFRSWVLGNGIQEKLFVGYRNQRFNYTLYYYDRAGNLMRTIPPAGTIPLPSSSLGAVDPARSSNSSSPLPDHQKPSNYQYNTLNQVTDQRTPDGGRTLYFYDAAGRAIFSQSEQQRLTGHMTYTLYDKQGRIMETGAAKIACAPYFDPFPSPDVLISYPCSYYVNGMKTPFPPQVSDLKSYSHEQIVSYVRSLSREEAVVTHYDTAAVNLGTATGMSVQENLRKRVSSIKYFDYLLSSDNNFAHYDYAMHFSYDIAGNVKTLTRDYPAWKDNHQQFKRVDYDYDVISGKVNLLSYDRGFADQYFQRYSYDGDNRITKVETSGDGYIWKRDAEYQYYQHGPLARMSLGDLRVQGVDYAYTIQGWLKAVNGDMLDATKDMGLDAGTAQSIHARDAAALSLDYFKGDYRPIGSTAVTHLSDPPKNMYNGNIPRATTAIAPFPSLNTNYVYDQLNRIIKAQYAYVNPYDGSLSNTADYYSKYAYDPDGNLKKLVRNGNAVGGNSQLMDSLNYHYVPGNVNNRLQNVTDYVSNNGFHNDIKNYTNAAASRYLYDLNGNVVKDQVAGQDTIQWNHYNKVTETRNDTMGNGLRFAYDGAGNRYIKTVYRELGDTTLERSDYYVRDAQGNILAVYDAEEQYKMGKTEWVEHINDHLLLSVSLQDFLHQVIVPHYLQDGHFRTAVLAGINPGSSFTASTIAGYPVSFYVTHSEAAKNNLLAHAGDYSDFYSSLSNYSQANNQPIIGSALFAQAGVNMDYNKGLLSTLLSKLAPTDARHHVLELMCSRTDSLFRDVLPVLGLEYDTSGCSVNADNAFQKIGDDEGTLDQFAGQVDKLYRAGYTDDYWSFIRALSLDTPTLNEPFYTAVNQGGVLIPYIQQAMENNTNGVALGAFLDTWSPARDLLKATGTGSTEMLSLIYDNDGETLLIHYINNYSGGNIAVVNQGLVAIPTLTPGSYLSSWNVPAVPDSIIHTVYAEVLNHERISLGEHHLYGSSRLGIKEYLPGQYYLLRDYSGPTPILDTIALNARRPWYSLEYNDAITALAQQPWSATDVSSYQVGHQVGQKQYELTNHLGNVQATVSDYPVFQPSGTGDTIRSRDPALVTAYDYYPFGMLMPGRGTDSMNTVSNVQGNILLVYNDFNDNTTQGWYIYNGGTSVTNENGRLKMVAGDKWQGGQKYMPVIPGKQYRVRFNLDMASAGSASIGLYSAGYLAVVYNTSGGQQDFTFTAPGNTAAVMVQTDYYHYPGNTYTFYMDNFILEEIKPRPEVPPVTNGGCITMSQSKWVLSYQTRCYDVPVWPWPNFYLGSLTGGSVSSTATISGSDIDMNLSAQEFAGFTFDAIAGQAQSVSIELSDVLSGTPILAVLDNVNGDWVNLTNQRVSVKGTYTLNFTPTTNQFQVRILGQGRVKARRICTTIPVLSQENVLVDICPEDNDRYRFGFNGQEKVNEWAGIGNYVDMGDRAQDTRVGRLGYTTDLLESRFPGQSPYIFAGNSPINYIDAEGQLKVSSQEKLAEYEQKYRLLMTYIETGQLSKDILKSEKMINAYETFRPPTQGQSPEESRAQTIKYIKFIAGWGTGPELEFVAEPGEGFDASRDAAGFFNKSTNTLQINERYAKYLNDLLKSKASSMEKLVAFTRFYMGVTHELAHRVNTADSRIPLGAIEKERSASQITLTNEAGYQFEQMVWGYDGYMPYDYYQEHSGAVEPSGDFSDYVEGIHSRKFKKGVVEGVVENALETNEGRLTLPTMPTK